jgi:hypothetical protein
MDRRLNLKTYWTYVKHLVTPGMQARFLSGVTLLHFCNEQEVKFYIAEAQLHTNHLLLR